MKTYRRSALASGLVRMWRGWSVLIPVVILNAAAQALIIWPEFELDDTWLNLLAAASSSIVFALAFGLVAATALHVPDGRVGWPKATTALRANAVRYSICALSLLVALAAALALNEAVGLLLLGLAPFLLLAAVDGERNPLAANFRTVGRRFWRWLITALIVGAVVVLGIVVSAVTAFFVRGSVASLLVWIVAGLVLAWFTTAWALIYRSAKEETSYPAATDEEAPGAEAA